MTATRWVSRATPLMGSPASDYGLRRRGRSSVVERQLPKLYVVGSIPIARSRSLPQDRLPARPLRVIAPRLRLSPMSVSPSLQEDARPRGGRLRRDGVPLSSSSGCSAGSLASATDQQRPRASPRTPRRGGEAFTHRSDAGGKTHRPLRSGRNAPSSSPTSSAIRAFIFPFRARIRSRGGAFSAARLRVSDGSSCRS